MKEKIGLFAKGIFSYERPTLSVSVERISLSVSTGKKVRGSFIVSSSGKTPFKGIVFCDETLMTFESPAFKGVENTISYTFDAQYLDKGDRITGTIFVVTEYGEVGIPFSCTVTPLSCETSIGPASDIFQFANLAQTNWDEAKDLFRNELFANVFASSSDRAELAIRALRGCNAISASVEEFLISLKKKHAVSVTVDKTEFSYDSPEECPDSEIITLTKDSWGYSRLSCTSEGDFITPSARVIWTDDFEGNTYKLSFNIDKDALKPGRNFGRIRLRSLRDDISIDIVCRKEAVKRRTLLVRSRIRHDMIEITRSYVKYRLGKIPAARFAAETQTILEGLKPLRNESIRDRLLMIYSLAVSGKIFKADSELRDVISDDEWRGAGPEVYGAVLFLESLIRREDPHTSLDHIRRVFDQSGDPRVMVMCILIDEGQYILPENAYEYLRESSAQTMLSQPVLAEAALIIAKKPEVVREVGMFEVKALELAYENKLLQKKTLTVIAFAATRCKRATYPHIKLFERLYAEFTMPELLEALCHLAVVSEIRNKETYMIMSMGCREHVRINGLFEACVIAYAKSGIKSAPDPVFITYFEKGIDADDTVKAALFAGVAANRAMLPAVSNRFNMLIREFTVNAITQGITDDDYSVLYNDFSGPETLSSPAVAQLPNLIFKWVITDIRMPEVRYVCVIHKGFTNERKYPVVDGRAVVDIINEDSLICFEDEDGTRLIECGYDKRKLIVNGELTEFCLENCGDDLRVALCLLGTGHSIDAMRRCKDDKEISEAVRLACTKHLIAYYYENLEGEMLEGYLVGLDLSKFKRKERASLIELMISRELYSLAFKNIELYGYHGMDRKKLARLVSKLLASKSEIGDARLLCGICEYVFEGGKEDKNVLMLLAAQYNGSCANTYAIWKKCVDEGIDTTDIEERLLGQLLFTESDMNYARTVFKHYYSHSSSEKLVKAFISYYAYGCLVYDRPPDEEMFMLMERESSYERNDVCVLAMLKDYSAAETFTEAQKKFIETELARLEGKNIIFPFFTKFGPAINVPRSIRDRFFIEYHTEPGRKVYIDYRIRTGDCAGDFIHEPMRDAGYGIFVKDLTIFCDEAVQYYITEESGDVKTITQTSEEYVQPPGTGNDTSRYGKLSLVIEALKMHDNKTLVAALEDYLVTGYLSDKLFKPL